MDPPIETVRSIRNCLFGCDVCTRTWIYRNAYEERDCFSLKVRNFHVDSFVKKSRKFPRYFSDPRLDIVARFFKGEKKVAF